MRSKANVVGRSVAKFRCQQGWTQTKLATNLQLAGCDVSRQKIAHIEAGNCSVDDGQIVFFAKVFRINVEELFPVEWRYGGKIKDLTGICPTKRPRKSRFD